MVGTNGVSYQKNGEPDSGTNGSSSSSSGGGLLKGWKKWGLGVVLVAILAAIYMKTTDTKTPEANKKAVEKEMTASDLSFDKNGKLKLFDSFSKYFAKSSARELT